VGARGEDLPEGTTACLQAGRAVLRTGRESLPPKFTDRKTPALKTNKRVGKEERESSV
jgi:hypothetical protein